MPADGVDHTAEMSHISVMTEITGYTRGIPTAIPRFILHWGDMGRQAGQMLTIPKAKIAALIRLGTRIASLLPLGGRP
jgi:hypothetical protein